MKQSEKRAEMSGPRTALARAIGARNSIAENVEALRKTRERLEDAIADARGRIDEAKTAAEEDRETRLQQVVAGADAHVLTRRDDGVSDLEREIEDLKGALQLARSKLGEEEVSLDLAGRRLENAVGDVMREEALEPLLAAAEKLKAELDVKRAALRFVRFTLAPDDPLQHRLDTLLSAPLAGERVAVSDHAVEPWRRWRLALMTHATADLSQ